MMRHTFSPDFDGPQGISKRFDIGDETQHRVRHPTTVQTSCVPLVSADEYSVVCQVEIEGHLVPIDDGECKIDIDSLDDGLDDGNKRFPYRLHMKWSDLQISLRNGSDLLSFQ